jgi:hypothetical protein
LPHSQPNPRPRDIPSMKLPIASPSEPEMKFFTRDLYLRFGSADDTEADRANEEWEDALARYRDHLNEISGRLPWQVKKLSELCLHDAEFLGYDQVADPLPRPTPAFGYPFWFATAMVSLKLQESTISLVYVLWDRVRESTAARWPYSRAQVHWLYDEVDVASRDDERFVHRILLSDSRIIEVPFASANVHTPSSSSNGQKEILQTA